MDRPHSRETLDERDPPGPSGPIAASIERARADEDFQVRLRTLMQEDRAILERLAR